MGRRSRCIFLWVGSAGTIGLGQPKTEGAPQRPADHTMFVERNMSARKQLQPPNQPLIPELCTPTR